MRMDENVKEVLWEMPHLKFVSLEKGDYCLMVESINLNDFVEDYLWDEYEYAATQVAMESPTSNPVYYNYLPSDLPLIKFLERLNELNPHEIQQVFNSIS